MYDLFSDLDEKGLKVVTLHDTNHSVYHVVTILGGLIFDGNLQTGTSLFIPYFQSAALFTMPLMSMTFEDVFNI
jgi:hypothetical protein